MIIEPAETFAFAAGKGLEGFPDPIALAIAAAGITPSIQRGSASIGSGATSASFALSPSVDLTKSLLSFRGVDVQGSTSTPQVFSVTTNIVAGGASVTFNRVASGVAVVCYGTVVGFAAGVITQQISIVIGSGAPSNTQTVTAVNTARTIIIPNGLQIHGSTTDGRVWSPWLVLTNSTTVTANRNTSGTQLTIKATLLEFT